MNFDTLQWHVITALEVGWWIYHDNDNGSISTTRQLGIGNRIGMDCCMGEFDFRKGSVFVGDRNALHQVQRGVDAIDHLPKYCVLVVEVRLLCVSHEKLRFVRIGARICHCNHTTIVELERGPNLVCKGCAPYALATFA